MSKCVTCGSELHPERAEKYDYCTRRECRERNARPATIAAVAVNKAADAYVVLDERTTEDLASGKYQDQRKSPSVTTGEGRLRSVPARRGTRPARRQPAPGKPERARWTGPQQELALIYHARGMGPDEIAAKLGLSRFTVTQMLLAANRVKP
jgi:hypothetical protein